MAHNQYTRKVQVIDDSSTIYQRGVNHIMKETISIPRNIKRPLLLLQDVENHITCTLEAKICNAPLNVMCVRLSYLDITKIYETY